MKYSEKLKDPRWQKLRLEVFKRDEWMCQWCYNKDMTLNVHHLYYESQKEPWEYPLTALITLCDDCHVAERDDRPIAERKLLYALKKQGFFAKDVLEIAEGFRLIKYHYYAPEVTASIIKWILKSPDILNSLGDLYFKMLKESKGGG